MKTILTLVLAAASVVGCRSTEHNSEDSSEVLSAGADAEVPLVCRSTVWPGSTLKVYSKNKKDESGETYNIEVFWKDDKAPTNAQKLKVPTKWAFREHISNPNPTGPIGGINPKFWWNYDSDCSADALHLLEIRKPDSSSNLPANTKVRMIASMTASDAQYTVFFKEVFHCTDK